MQEHHPSRYNIISLLCGVLSGIMFTFFASIPESDLLLLFISTIPLSIPALYLSWRIGKLAFISAFVTVAITLGVYDAGFFLMLIELPLAHFISKILLWRGDENRREWYPVLNIITETTLMIAAFFMLSALTFVSGQDTQIKTLILNAFADQIKNPNPEVEHYIRLILEQWSFIIFVVAGWIWVMTIYAFIIISNRILSVNSMALRDNIAITEKNVPLYLMLILSVAGMMAVLASGNDKFVGQVLFLLLLLPYMISGIVLIHELCQRFRYSKIILTIFYVTMLCLPWLMLVMIITGFYNQIAVKLTYKK